MRTRLFITMTGIALAAAGACRAGDGPRRNADSTGSGEAPARPAAGPREGAGIFVVRMLDDMRFDPPRFRVRAGDTIVWVNEGDVPHTSTGDPSRAGVPEHARLPAGGSPWDSGFIGAGREFRLVPQIPGDYTYLCTLHEAAGMVGAFTVVSGDR